MEESAHDTCNIVYLCAYDKEDVHELYHQRSPPAAPSPASNGHSTLEQAYENVRSLLDQDQGGFNEVFLCSRHETCSARLESYANTSPTVVLIELLRPGPAASGAAPDLSLDKGSSFAFLQALGVDVQGARYQKPVLPFVLLDMDDASFTDAGHDSDLNAACLNAGAIDIIRSPLQYEDINHLIGHLKEKVRAPARMIGSQMAHNLVNSIHDSDEPAMACHRPDLLLSKERKAVVEDAVGKWHFPASDLNMDELTYAIMVMLEHLLRVPELEPYALPRERMMTFLLATRRQYKHEREVHYHNWRHAVDVTQSIYCFLLDLRLSPSSSDQARTELNEVEQMLTHLDALILIVSAIGHDVGHPGVNNAFLVAVNHPLAQTYNDKSVLENYHCAAYSQLLRRHWPGLHNITSFRSTMISTILATDMQRHFEYMKSMGELKSQVEHSSSSPSEWSDKDKEHTRELIMALLIKAADISNVARPFEVSAGWAKILMNEFARQGELESELSIPTCLFGGPPDTEDMLAAAQSQKGFMGLFGLPLFKGISEILPCISRTVKELENNQSIWEKRIEEERSQRTPSGNEGHLTFSSVTNEEVAEATKRHHKSEPAAVPTVVPQSPSKPISRSPVNDAESSPTRHATFDLRQQLIQGMANGDDKRSSTPFLGSAGAPLSPHGGSASRRSSKDVALDQLQQLTAYAHQNQSLSPTPSSRRESADAGVQIHQSYPSSRRGSKDESLTAILVTSGGTPNRRNSPSSPSNTSSPGKHSTKWQSISQQTQRQTAHTSLPSSRSHAASTGTVGTPTLPSVSTQGTGSTGLSSDEGENGLKAHHSIPSTEDPFMEPENWPNSLDGQHRGSVPDGVGRQLPNTRSPKLGKPSNDSGHALVTTMSGGTDDSRTSPRKSGQKVRESRSRSRLRGLKFWKRKRDAVGSEPTSASMTESPTASP